MLQKKNLVENPMFFTTVQWFCLKVFDLAPVDCSQYCCGYAVQYYKPEVLGWL